MADVESNLTFESKEAMSYSREEALRLSNDFIGQSHILLGIIKRDNNIAMKVLTNLSVDTNSLKSQLENIYKKSHGFMRDRINSLPLTKEAEQSVYRSFSEAKETVPFNADTIHLLLAIIKTADAPVDKILAKNEINYDLIKTKFEEITFQDNNNKESEFNKEKKMRD